MSPTSQDKFIGSRMDDQFSMCSQAEFASRCHICPIWLVKVLVFGSMMLALCAMFFGMFSFGWSAWVRLEPEVPNSKEIFGIRRSVGALYLCLDEPIENPDSIFNKTLTIGSCLAKDFGQYLGNNGTDLNYQQITHLRAAHVALHLAGILVVSLTFFLSLGSLSIWFRSRFDTEYYRRLRCAFGILLAIGAFAYLIGMLLFHIVSEYEKEKQTAYLMFDFAQWPETYKTSTRFSFTTGYILAWVAVACSFISSWMLLSTSCCWTYNLPDSLIDEYFSHLDSKKSGVPGIIGWNEFPVGFFSSSNNGPHLCSSIDGGLANLAFDNYDGHSNRPISPSTLRLPRYATTTSNQVNNFLEDENEKTNMQPSEQEQTSGIVVKHTA